MGGDLVLHILVRPKGRRLRWLTATRKVLGVRERLAGTRAWNELIDDRELCEQCRSKTSHPANECGVVVVIARDLAALAGAVEEGERSLVVWKRPTETIYFIGGVSWGDAPSELYASVERLEAAGVLEDLGFE